MNEQEKEFMVFVEWLPKNIEKFVNAKPEDIISYLEELGKTPEGQNELKSLITKYKQSKNTVTLNKKGGKVETLIKKFYAGGPYRDTVEVHNKWRFIPLWMSINAANGVDVPKKHNTHDPRQFKFIKSPNGQRWGIIQNKVNGRSTIFELDSNNEPISSEYGGQKYEYGDDMFRKHVNNYNFYTKDIFIPSDKKGGKIDYLVNKLTNGGVSDSPKDGNQNAMRVVAPSHNKWHTNISYLTPWIMGWAKTHPVKIGETDNEVYLYETVFDPYHRRDRLHINDYRGNEKRRIERRIDMLYPDTIYVEDGKEYDDGNRYLKYRELWNSLNQK